MLALRTAVATKSCEREVLAEFLYAYNRRPGSWSRLDDHLNTHCVPAIFQESDVLQSVYSCEIRKDWIFWTVRVTNVAFANPTFCHKVYISVSIPNAALTSTFVNLCKELSPPQFKIATGSEGYLRPDSWVVYFHNHDSLVQFAERLAPAVAACSPWGVPFTIRWRNLDGLTSAIDPYSPSDSNFRHSWRGMLANNLGYVLGKALEEGASSSESVEAALEWATGKGFRPDEWV